MNIFQMLTIHSFQAELRGPYPTWLGSENVSFHSQSNRDQCSELRVGGAFLLYAPTSVQQEQY